MDAVREIYESLARDADAHFEALAQASGPRAAAGEGAGRARGGGRAGEDSEDDELAPLLSGAELAAPSTRRRALPDDLQVYPTGSMYGDVSTLLTGAEGPGAPGASPTPAEKAARRAARPGRLQALRVRARAKVCGACASCRKSRRLPGARGAQAEREPRRIFLNSHCHPDAQVTNAIKNTKYTVITFIPLVLKEQFKYFFNLYFLIITLTQFYPPLKVGFLFTYLAPLLLVLGVTCVKEGYDDIQRYIRDRQINKERFRRLDTRGGAFRGMGGSAEGPAGGAGSGALSGPAVSVFSVASEDIRVGDLLVLHSGQRVPADCLVLYTSNQPIEELLEEGGAATGRAVTPGAAGAAGAAGTAGAPAAPREPQAPPPEPVAELYLKTDQLDGETDWKLRRPVGLTQKRGVRWITAPSSRLIIDYEAPDREVYRLNGRATVAEGAGGAAGAQGAPAPGSPASPFLREPISLDNTIWASTVIASPLTTVALVLYTGRDTKIRLNTNKPRVKSGIFDKEIDLKAQLMFWVQVIMSLIYTIFSGANPADLNFYLTAFRFLLLFSSIIPISLRVNLDIGKIVYSLFVYLDKVMVDAVVRTTTIPEQLGRIRYILSDKTGTITQNRMIFRSLHTGRAGYEVRKAADREALLEEVREAFRLSEGDMLTGVGGAAESAGAGGPSRPGAAALSVTAALAGPAGTSVVSVATDAAGPSGLSSGLPSDPAGQQTAVLARRTRRGRIAYSTQPEFGHIGSGASGPDARQKDARLQRLYDSAISLAICNTVTPIPDEAGAGQPGDAQEAKREPWLKRLFNRMKRKGQFYHLVVNTAEGSKRPGRGSSRLAPLRAGEAPAEEEDEVVYMPYAPGQEPEGAGAASGAAGAAGTPAGAPERASSAQSGATRRVVLQASSPDEVSLVKFASSMGVHLYSRDRSSLSLLGPDGRLVDFDILYTFPFTSATKRMAIVVRNHRTREILLLAKGADSVMLALSSFEYRAESAWVSEQVDAMAARGLRTLVFGQRVLGAEEFATFEAAYTQAEQAMEQREERMLAAQDLIMHSLRLITVTGVEDLLQEDVKQTIEQLRQAGMRIFLLTGDKVETSKTIAQSTGLLSPGEEFVEIVAGGAAASEKQAGGLVLGDSAAAGPAGPAKPSPTYISDMLDVVADRYGYRCVPIIDGTVLDVILATQRPGGKRRAGACGKRPSQPETLCDKFISTVARTPCFVCSRCSPKQKAAITALMSALHTPELCTDPKCRCLAPKCGCLAIGDGGNDVSMITAASVGVGLVGKEGKQASLAGDYSLTRFKDLSTLLLWHGRNSYMRASGMAQFVIARGITISVMQAVFSACFFFTSVVLFTGWLSIGYSVIFTALPVIAIVLDQDVPCEAVYRYPQLYGDALYNRRCNFATLLLWIAVSIWEGVTIMSLGEIVVTEGNFYNLVGTSFSCLVITELLTLGFTIHKWTWAMVISELLSMVVYIAFMFLLTDVFDYHYILSWQFWVKCLVVTLFAVIPPYVCRAVAQCIRPSDSYKLRGEYRHRRRSASKRGRRAGASPAPRAASADGGGALAARGDPETLASGPAAPSPKAEALEPPRPPESP